MIVPMKKVSLIIMGDKKKETLKKLRKLGIVHIEIAEGSGEKLIQLNERVALLESSLFLLGKNKNVEPKDVDIPSNPVFPIRVGFCIGAAGEEVEFFTAK